MLLTVLCEVKTGKITFWTLEDEQRVSGYSRPVTDQSDPKKNSLYKSQESCPLRLPNICLYGKILSFLKTSYSNTGEKCTEAGKCSQIVISQTLGEQT